MGAAHSQRVAIAAQGEHTELKSKTPAPQRLQKLKNKASTAVLFSGLMGKKASVVAVMDISLSMTGYFRSGLVQALFDRLLALGCQFDDNDAIDVWLFGRESHYMGEVGPNNFDGAGDTIQRQHRLETSTRYAKPLNDIVKHFCPKTKGGGMLSRGPVTVKKPLDHPVFVMFITDGDNFDKRETTETIIKMSGLPIFVQFVGIGCGGNGFPYLRQLDDLQGRVVDNVGFCELPQPESVSDEDLFGQLLNEFPD